MKQRTTRLTPACCLRQQGFRDALQRLSMTLMLVMLTAMTAWAQGVDYIDANGVVKNTATDDIVGNDNPTVLTGGGATTLLAGWYVVNSDITYTGTVTLDGDVNIILADGKTMTINVGLLDGAGIRGIAGEGENDLTIYGQTAQDGTLSITAFGVGIYCGTLTINSGTVNVTGSSSTSNAIYGGQVIINGGTVNVKSSGTAIYATWVIINGGVVTATANGKDSHDPLVLYYSICGRQGVSINGGQVTATGNSGRIASDNSSDITLGHTKATDFISFKRINAAGEVNIKSGQRLTDGTNIYTGNGVSIPNDVTLRQANFTDNGDNSYTIWNAAGWDIFCDALDDGTSFTDKTVKLNDNIEVSRMAGSSDKPFTGTFDGQGNTLTVSYGTAESPIAEEYAAPFRYVDGGSIENLRVSGTIYTSAQYAGGFIGIAEGSASIMNSVSGVTINSSIEGDGTHGGFVGLQGDTEGNRITIEGCIFNGKLLGSSTTSCGGFVGWRKKTVNILNSLYAPAAATGSETWINTGSCATFSRNNANFTNCYYTQTLGTAQGMQRRSIAAGENVTVAHAGVATTYNVSGITAYKASAESSSFTDGLLYNNVLYAGSDDAVRLTLANTPPTGYSLGGYTTYTASLDGAMLTGDGVNYTLTMPDADVTIGATFMEPVSVSYIDADGKEQTVDAIPLQGGGATTLAPGWYVVNSKITYTGTVSLGGDVNIILADGMTMTANGDMAMNANGNNYGIYGPTNALTIYGQTGGTGTLIATGNPGAIRCALTMTGGTVNATGTTFAIGDTTTDSDGTTIFATTTVSGGTLTATATGTAAPVLTRRRSDWPFVYTELAIGGNLALSGPATVTVNDPIIGDVTIADGLTFTDGNKNYRGTLSSDDKTAIAGKTLRLAAIQLADAADNTAIIAKCNGVTGIDITLQGRTLWKDGAWNTLCLPFDVTIAGSILDGADVRALDNANLTGNVLTLNFTDEGTVTEIEAGTPYIIKWASGANITDPEFTGVTVKSGMNDFESIDHKVEFKGTYSPMSWNAEDRSILFVGDDNQLHWPKPDASLGACRAYFELSDVEPEPGTGGAPELRIVLNFGEEEKTGISSLTPDPSPKGEGSDYYTLDGRKLNAKPMKKGLYIHNGRKVVIK